MDSELRVSDDDRHAMIAELQRHTVAGRLTLDELSDRIDSALRARTRGDLAAVTRDLPAAAETAAAEATAAPRSGRREIPLVFAGAVATLLLLWLLVTLGR